MFDKIKEFSKNNVSLLKKIGIIVAVCIAILVIAVVSIFVYIQNQSKSTDKVDSKVEKEQIEKPANDPAKAQNTKERNVKVRIPYEIVKSEISLTDLASGEMIEVEVNSNNESKEKFTTFNLYPGIFRLKISKQDYFVSEMRIVVPSDVKEFTIAGLYLDKLGSEPQTNLSLIKIDGSKIFLSADGWSETGSSFKGLVPRFYKEQSISYVGTTGEEMPFFVSIYPNEDSIKVFKSKVRWELTISDGKEVVTRLSGLFKKMRCEYEECSWSQELGKVNLPKKTGTYIATLSVDPNNNFGINPSLQGHAKMIVEVLPASAKDVDYSIYPNGIYKFDDSSFTPEAAPVKVGSDYKIRFGLSSGTFYESPSAKLNIKCTFNGVTKEVTDANIAKFTGSDLNEYNIAIPFSPNVAGKYLFEISVDTDNAVKEKNEKNNYAKYEVIVK